jgi:hypothetical protein
MFKTISIVAGLVGLAAALAAQTYPDTYKIDYYSTAFTPVCPTVGQAGTVCQDGNYDPDSTVRLTNAGTQLGSTGDPSGNLCAMIYVFAPDQQMAECCGCALTPDALLTLSVANDLTDNPLTPVHAGTGAIKIVSSTGAPTCNPAKPVPVAGIRAWATHVQGEVSGLPSHEIVSNFLTETAFSDGVLSAGELKLLQNKCASIHNNGSGFGICSCGVDGTL